MKRLFSMVSILLLCVCALTACGGNDDDEDKIIDGKNGEYVINGHKFIDLGLPSGLLWAECNVGAATPEDAGYYYAWGETEPKNHYVIENYKFADRYSITKYNTSDTKVTLEATDDVATVKWGKRCHIPTVAEMKELYRYCYWTRTNSNNVAGFTVTGPNGKSIFLPLAGQKSSTLELKGQAGYYWSSSTYDDTGTQILMIGIGVPISVGGGFARVMGISVRPVARK